MKNISIKKISVYLIKVLILFLILYFTIVEPTGLILFYYVVPWLYVLLYLILIFAISKIAKDKNDPKNIFIKHILQPFLLIIGVVIMFLILYGVKYINNINEQNKIESIIKKADDVLEYNLAYEYNPSPKELQYRHNTIFIDYDKMTISFLLIDYFHEFHTFNLIKDKNCNNTNNIQVDYTIPSSKNILRTFYPDEENEHRTTAIQLIMKDDSIYSVCDLKSSGTNYYFYLSLRSEMEIKEK